MKKIIDCLSALKNRGEENALTRIVHIAILYALDADRDDMVHSYPIIKSSGEYKLSGVFRQQRTIDYDNYGSFNQEELVLQLNVPGSCFYVLPLDGILTPTDHCFTEEEYEYLNEYGEMEVEFVIKFDIPDVLNLRDMMEKLIPSDFRNRLNKMAHQLVYHHSGDDQDLLDQLSLHGLFNKLFLTTAGVWKKYTPNVSDMVIDVQFLVENRHGHMIDVSTTRLSHFKHQLQLTYDFPDEIDERPVQTHTYLFSDRVLAKLIGNDATILATTVRLDGLMLRIKLDGSCVKREVGE